MRFEPVFTEIRMAREEDDPTLPMRQWERPLKKADWPLIVERCTAILSRQSKDLQVAAWLLEAWTRQKGWAGVEKGLALLNELCGTLWDCVHPRIDEDGDSDARVAPLQWVNESLPLTIKVHVPLVNMGARKPPRITMAEWDRLTAAELSGDVPEPSGNSDDVPVTRSEVIAKAHADKTGLHVQQLQLVRASIAHVDTLTRLLDERMGNDAPNLHTMRGVLEAAERTIVQLQAPAAQPQPAPVEEESMEEHEAMGQGPEEGDDAPAPIQYTAGGPNVRINGVRSREEAYEALEKLADFLEKTEPHSPTPYLIRRAVNWGRMPLPELMQEIMREEGDLNRMANLLGLNR